MQLIYTEGGLVQDEHGAYHPKEAITSPVKVIRYELYLKDSVLSLKEIKKGNTGKTGHD